MAIFALIHDSVHESAIFMRCAQRENALSFPWRVKYTQVIAANLCFDLCSNISMRYVYLKSI